MNWSKERYRDTSDNKMRLVGYWADLAGYYMDEKTGCVWAYGVTKRWVKQAETLEAFRQKIIDKTLRGQLIEGENEK